MDSTNNLVFLEILEWFDETGKELAHRLPESGSGEIKFGAQVIVRESQAAVFYSKGIACDAMGPGRHTMTTMNVPLLTKVLSIPWGMKSPFRAECYFVNLKTFINLRWGTRDPVAFRDSELGLIRLRAFGKFNVQVVQPVLFINSLVGTQARYTTDALEQYLSDVIVSRFNDYLGENLDTLLNLPSQYDELSVSLTKRLQEDFENYGIALKSLYINAITPPEKVQEAIDDRSRLSAVGDRLDDLVKLKMSVALENSNGNGAMGGGIGMGMGLLMPGLLGGMVAQGAQKQGATCPECKSQISAESRFCNNCGCKILQFKHCSSCGRNLSPDAKFCSNCGTPADLPQKPKKCGECGAENRPEAKFCNNCGQIL